MAKPNPNKAPEPFDDWLKGATFRGGKAVWKRLPKAALDEMAKARAFNHAGGLDRISGDRMCKRLLDAYGISFSRNALLKWCSDTGTPWAPGE